MEYYLKKYKHLSIYERSIIQVRLHDGYSVYKIAKEIGRAYNTIRSEIKRGTQNKKEYRAETGQSRYKLNRVHCHRKTKFFDCKEFSSLVEKNFYDEFKKWSIDVSVHKIKKEKFFPPEKSACTKTIYNWIHRGFFGISKTELPECVKRTKKKRIPKIGKKKLGRSIDFRPREVSLRNTFGHWEIDTVIGKKYGKNQIVLTLAERLTDYYIVRKFGSKTAQSVLLEMLKIKKEFGKKYSQVFKTITADRGSEFADLFKMEKYGSMIFFAHPYSSYERPINERHNRILRRFIPKSANINCISNTEVESYQDIINGLPRKKFDYRTPEELFQKHLDLIYKRNG
jgi:IS30 family transposase